MDASIEAELRIRKRVENILNKTREEFPDKTVYDDYLEMRETYIFNLVFHEDVAETEAKLAEYQRVNQASIAQNRARLAGVEGGGTEAVLVQSAIQEGSGAAPQGAGGYAPSVASMPATATRPVPMHTDFSQDQEGRFILRADRVKKVSWREVARASGWDPQAVMLKALKDSAVFWL